MRTALISVLKRTLDGELRAHEIVAGRALLDWQVDLAINLGCERIICLCDAPTPVVIDQQKRIEDQNLAFHMARGPLQITSLVRDEDVLVLMLDGLFISKEPARELVGSDDSLRQAIWAVPAHHVLSATFPFDFERIDREQHWAGFASIPGRCVRGLADLPGDSDAFSLLLRLALQEGTPRYALPSKFLENDSWFLVSDSAALERCENALMEASLPDPQWSGPVNALATVAVRNTATYWLHSAPEISAIAALSLALLAPGLTAFGFGTAGLFFASLGAIAAKLSRDAISMRCALGGKGRQGIWRRGFSAAIVILSILTLALANSLQNDWIVRASLPIFAIGLASIAGQDRTAKFSAFWRDTPLHLVFFALADLLGVLQESIIVIALAALTQLVCVQRNNRQNPSFESLS